MKTLTLSIIENNKRTIENRSFRLSDRLAVIALVQKARNHCYCHQVEGTWSLNLLLYHLMYSCTGLVRFNLTSPVFGS